MKTLLALTACSILASPAFAGGVVLINQSNALAGGVTPGDAPGFPVTISVAGSYQLSSNLVVPDANTTAIEVTADNVTIDLNGFSIIGPNVCAGKPVSSCSPNGGGTGITSENFDNTSLTISNGTISGMGLAGISVLGEAHIDNVHVSNCGAGIYVNSPGSASIVSSSTVYGNLDLGIQTNGSVISSVASYNGGAGIFGGPLILNSLALFNGSDGIDTGPLAALVSGNSAIGNTGHGISVNCPTNLVSNVVNGNAGGNIFTGGSGCTRANNLPTP